MLNWWGFHCYQSSGKQNNHIKKYIKKGKKETDRQRYKISWLCILTLSALCQFPLSWFRAQRCGWDTFSMPSASAGEGWAAWGHHRRTTTTHQWSPLGSSCCWIGSRLGWPLCWSLDPDSSDPLWAGWTPPPDACFSRWWALTYEWCCGCCSVHWGECCASHLHTQHHYCSTLKNHKTHILNRKISISVSY